MEVFALRLQPDDDLRQSLKKVAIEKQLKAGFVLSAIGSLQQAAIRFANQETSQIVQGKFEIIALNGTLSLHGLHLHIAIADSQGTLLGGHLSDGCLIYTTAEIIISEVPDITFHRTLDRQTGFPELEISPHE